MSAVSAPREQTESHRDLAAAWAFVLQVAGGATALGALVYGTGAATMWIRMKTAGYPPDVAVEHQPRSEMIALGVRGFGLILGAAVVVAAVLALALAVGWILHAATGRRLGRALARLGARTGARIGLALVLTLIVAAAFVSWRFFGAALSIAAGAGILYPAVGARRLPGPRRLLATALVIVVGAVCWQISGTERIQGVYLTPVPPELKGQVRDGNPNELRFVPFPYFGEDARHVYVETVYSVDANAQRQDWNFDGEELSIAEIDRDKVLLTFPRTSDVLYDKTASPVCTFLEQVAHVSAFC